MNVFYGYAYGIDTQCNVTCDCGEELSVSDYKIFWCKCGKGYINQFITFQLDGNKECDK